MAMVYIGKYFYLLHIYLRESFLAMFLDLDRFLRDHEHGHGSQHEKHLPN